MINTLDDVYNILQAMARKELSVDEATTAVITDFFGRSSAASSLLLHLEASSGKVGVYNVQIGGFILALQRPINQQASGAVEFVLYENVPTLNNQRSLSSFAQTVRNAVKVGGGNLADDPNMTYDKDFEPYQHVSRFGEFLNLIATDSGLRPATALVETYGDLLAALDGRDKVTIADFHSILDLCWAIKQDITKPHVRGVLLTVIFNILAASVNRHFTARICKVRAMQPSQEKIREVNTLIYILKVFKDTVKPFRPDLLTDDAHRFIEQGSVLIAGWLKFERLYNAIFELGNAEASGIQGLKDVYAELSKLELSCLSEISFVDAQDIAAVVDLLQAQLVNEDNIESTTKNVYTVALYLFENNHWSGEIRGKLAARIAAIAHEVNDHLRLIKNVDFGDAGSIKAHFRLLLEAKRLVSTIDDVKVIFPFYDSGSYSELLESQRSLRAYQKQALGALVAAIDVETSARPGSKSHHMFKVNLAENRVEVNYPERLMALHKEYLRMKELFADDQELKNVNLSPEADRYIAEKKRFWHYAIRLKNIAEFYNNMERDIRPQYLRLLASDIIELEEHFKKTQGDDYKGFIERSEGLIIKMKEKIEKAMGIEKRVLGVFRSRVHGADTDFSYLSDISAAISTLATDKASKFERSFAIYIKHQAMAMYFAQCRRLMRQKETLLFNSTIKRIQLRYDSDSNQCELYPTLQALRKELYDSANIVITSFFSYFDEFDEEYLKKALYNAIGKDTEELYKWIEEMLRGLKQRIEELLGFTTISAENNEADTEEGLVKAIEVLNVRIKDLGLVEEYTIYKKYILVDVTQLKINYIDVLKQERAGLVQRLKPLLKNLLRSCEDMKGDGSVDQRKSSSDSVRAVHDAYKRLKELRTAKQREFGLIEASLHIVKEVEEEKMLFGHLSDFVKGCDAYEKKIRDAQADIKKREGEFKQILEQRKAGLTSEVSSLCTKSSVLMDYRARLDDGLKDYDDNLAVLKGLAAEVETIDDIDKKIQSLKDDCEFFNVQFDEAELRSSYNAQATLSADDINAVKATRGFYDLLEEHKATKINEFINEHLALIHQRLFNVYEDLSGSRPGARAVFQPLLLKEIEEWRQFFDVLVMIKGAGYSTEDWPKVTSILTLHSSDADYLSLKDLLDKRATITAKSADIKRFNLQLVEQANLRGLLKDINDWWETVEFGLMSYESSSKAVVTIVGGWEELLSQLEDYKAQLSIIKDSTFISLYGDKVEVLESHFKFCENVLYGVKRCQKQFIYLEPVMQRNQIDALVSKDFEAGRSILLGVFRYIEKNKKLRYLKEYVDITRDVEACVVAFESVQKRLHEYLEEKRQNYPRLYFIGDEDLLELLGNYQTHLVLNSHLSKIFDKVNDVGLSIRSEIDSVSSEDVYGHKETLTLAEPVALLGKPIEAWLSKLEAQIIKALVDHLSAYKFSSIEDLRLFENLAANWDTKPGQVVQLAQELIFTNLLHKYSTSSAVGLLKSKYVDYLQQLAAHVPETPLKSLQLKALKLSTITKVHILERISGADGTWETFKTLKFARPDPGTVHGDVCGVQLPYLWEYKGNVLPLVHTYITDKCFISISQAVRNKAGCNLTGPAGTGKTETIKSLGSLLARKVLVFNCDESLDYVSTIKIFKGIMGVGAWGCLDEFNRLSESQLSTASQLIQDLQTALRAKKAVIQVDKYTFALKDEAGVYITMNPKSKEYGARSSLPQNLKSLFRIINVTRPASAYIAEVMLSTEGFLSARSLAAKLVYAMTRLQASVTKQRFYDWSLRKVKAVLLTAGDALRADDSDTSADDKETRALVKSLEISVGSILTPGDSIIYEGVVKEIFGYSPVSIGKQQMHDGDTACDPIEDKLEQLREQLKRRTGVIIFGRPNTQKTRLWRLYQERNKDSVEVHRLNPKAGFRHEFIGSLDPNTGIFKDGSLTLVSRHVAKNTAGKQQLVVIDSEVDPGWIEALNSVLDDNRLLTLPSGERIQFDNRVNFIFECRDIEFASPATVSRMGLISMNAVNSNDYEAVDTILRDYEAERWLDMCLRNFELLKRMDNYPEAEARLISLLLLAGSISSSVKDRLATSLGGGVTDDLENSPMDFILSQITTALIANANLIIATKREDDATLALQLAFDNLNQGTKLRVLSVSCTNNIDVEYLRQLISSNCALREKDDAIILEPQDYGKLVLVLHDIESVARDEYSHSSFYELLHYIATHHRFFDGTRFVETGCFISFVFVVRDLGYFCADKTYSKLASNALAIDIDGLISQELLEGYRSNGSGHAFDEIGVDLRVFEELAEEIKVGSYGRVLKLFMRYFDMKKILGVVADSSAHKKEVFTQLLRSELISKAQSKEEQTSIVELLGDKCSIEIADGTAYLSLLESQGREIRMKDQAAYKALVNKLKQRFERENHGFEFLPTSAHLSLFNLIETNISLKDAKHHLIAGRPGYGREAIVQILSTGFDAKAVSFHSSGGNSAKDIEKFLLRCLNDIFINGTRIFAMVETHQLRQKLCYDQLIRFVQEKELSGFSKEDREALVNQDKDYNGKGYSEYFRGKIDSHLVLFIFCNSEVVDTAELIADFPMMLKSFNIIEMGPMVDSLYVEEMVHHCIAKHTPRLKSFAAGISEAMGMAVGAANASKLRAFEKTIEMVKGAKSELIDSLINRLQNGLDSIHKAEEEVKALHQQEEERKAQLITKEQESSQYLAQIEVIYNETSASREKMKLTECRIHEESKEASKHRRVVEVELEGILPLVEQAKSEVKNINKKQLDDIRMLKSPPESIIVVFSALLKMMGSDKVDWNEMKRFMADRGALESILDFDPRSITKSRLRALDDYTAANSGIFEGKLAYRAYHAAGCLADYIIAMVRLAHTYAKIEPLEAQLKQCEKRVSELEAELEKQQAEISKVDADIGRLKAELAQKTGEAELCKKEVAEIQKKGERARALLDGFVNEKQRWGKRLEAARLDHDLIEQKSLLAAFHITFNDHRYANSYKDLLRLFELESFDFVGFLAEPVDLLEYRKNGLPDLQNLIQNALKVNFSYSVPLVVDPSSVLLEFYTRLNGANGVVVDLMEPSHHLKLESCIKFGKTALVVNVTEKVPTHLFSLLRKEFRVQSNGTSQVEFMNKSLNVSERFSMILFNSYNMIPTIREFGQYLNIIDNTFNDETVRFSLLRRIMQSKKPEMVENCARMMELEVENSRTVLSMEERILDLLDNRETSLLEDEKLQKALEDVKKQTSEVQRHMADFSKTKTSMENEEQKFLKVVDRLSAIFIEVDRLKKLTPFYSLTLDFYMNVMDRSLAEAETLGQDATDALLVSIFSKNLLNALGIAFSNKDKPILVLITLKAAGVFELTKEDWAALSAEKGDTLKSAPIKSLNLKYTDAACWNYLRQNYKDLYSSIIEKPEAYMRWLSSLNIEQARALSLSNKQALLLTKAFRVNAYADLIESMSMKQLGVKYTDLSPSTSRLAKLLTDSQTRHMVMLYRSGCDPAHDVEAAVAQLGLKCASISCGQLNKDQVSLSLQSNSSDVVVVKNLHFSPWVFSYLLSAQMASGCAFVFLTEDIKGLSRDLLVKCSRVYYEKAEGVKRIIQQAIQSVGNSVINEISGQANKYLFCLAYLYAVISEREKYVPLGWEKAYEFDINDFGAAVDFLHAVESNQSLDTGRILREVLKYAFYGSKIDSEADELKFKALVEKIVDIESGRIKLPLRNDMGAHLECLKGMADIGLRELDLGHIDLDELQLQATVELFERLNLIAKET